MDASPYYYAYTRGLPRCAEHAEVRLVKQPAYVESTLLKKNRSFLPFLNDFICIFQKKAVLLQRFWW